MIDFESHSDKVKGCEERAARMEKAYWNLKSGVLELMSIYDELGLGNPHVTLDCVRGMVEEFILEYVPKTEISNEDSS